MSSTKIVLNRQSDLILDNAVITSPSGLEKSDISNLVDDLSALTASDVTLQSNIDAETTARTYADTVLQSNIDAETSRINAILEASDADKDSFAEIVTLINTVDTENDNAFAGYVLSNNAALDAERSIRLSADTALEGSIDAEASVRLSADTRLQESIDAEASVRLSADTGLQESILAEASVRVLSDNQVADYVDAARPRIVDSYTGDGLENAFSFNVVGETMIVFLNGLMQSEGDDYTINKVAGSVEFGSAPNSGSIIKTYGVPNSAIRPSFASSRVTASASDAGDGPGTVTASAAGDE